MCNPDAGQRRAGIRPHLARGPVCLCRTSPASCAACAGSLRRGTRPIGTGTSLHASVRDTSDWQFACLPSAPQYCGATPTEAVPFLGSAVSSTTRTGSSQEPRGRRICRSHRPSARSSRWLLPHVLLVVASVSVSRWRCRQAANLERRDHQPDPCRAREILSALVPLRQPFCRWANLLFLRDP